MKIMKTFSIVALLVVLTALTATAQENRSFPVKSINRVQVSSGIDLYLTHGNTESLTIKGNSTVLKEVEAVQNGDALVIRFKDNFSWKRMMSQSSVKAYLSYKTLRAITASGGSDVYSQNMLTTDNLSLTASGGADLDLNISCKNLTLRISGGSDADLSGKAENMIAELSGGSDLDAMSLAVVNARVSASGGADANVNVSGALEAHASGGSDIHYKGNPSVQKNNSNSGSVKRIN